MQVSSNAASSFQESHIGGGFLHLLYVSAPHVLGKFLLPGLLSGSTRSLPDDCGSLYITSCHCFPSLRSGRRRGRNKNRAIQASPSRRLRLDAPYIRAKLDTRQELFEGRMGILLNIGRNIRGRYNLNDTTSRSSRASRERGCDQHGDMVICPLPWNYLGSLRSVCDFQQSVRSD